MYSVATNFRLASGSPPPTKPIDPVTLIANTLDGLGSLIEAATRLASAALPASEEARLNALADTLQATADGLKAGEIDLATAKSAVQSTLAVTMDALGGVGLSVLFGAVTLYASTLTPLPPHVEAFFVGGSAVAGFLIEMTIGNSGIYDKLAEVLTDGLFGFRSKLLMQ